MYFQTITQLIHALSNIEKFLRKAQHHAAAKKFDVNILMAATLAPDMKPFSYQVTSACNYVKQAAAWLSGEPLPVHDDTEKTLEEIHARIQKTVESAASIGTEKFEGAGQRRISYSWKPNLVMDAETYLLQMAVPNVYFHVAMAYAILRSNGVDVGKMDYLEPLRFLAA